MGTIWEIGLGQFLLVTVFLGGGAAYLSGRAVALTWRRLPQLLVFVLLLSLAVRFIHFALFHGSFFAVAVGANGAVSWQPLFTALHYWAVDMVVLLLISGLGFRVTRTAQMIGQYSWLFERQSRLSWRRRDAASP
jgi:hypothetical protein